jgi:voltage-gated potassium channel Kch
MLSWFPLVIIITVTGLIGMLIGRGYLSFGRLFLRRLHPGVPIVYRMIESSTRPVARPRDLQPAEHGDLYCYLSTKYWRVEKVLQDGWVIAITPLMEHIYLRRDDPGLRKANLLDRLRFWARFPHLP